MPGRPRPADQPTLPSQVMGFAELYGQSCAGCHGTDGRLGAARPLNDPVYLALVPPDRLRMIIAQGVPGTAMPGFATGAGGPLTEAQVDALIHEMLQRWSRPLPPPEGPLPPYAAPAMGADGSPAGDPERGLRVYAEACAGCHGADGKGAKGGIGRGCRVSRPGERSGLADGGDRRPNRPRHARLALGHPRSTADGTANRRRRGLAGRAAGARGGAARHQRASATA